MLPLLALALLCLEAVSDARRRLLRAALLKLSILFQPEFKGNEINEAPQSLCAPSLPRFAHSDSRKVARFPVEV